MSKWLITGAAGFIGAHLLAELHQHPPEELDAVLAPTRAELDLTQADAVAEYLRRHRVSGIVHLAASLERSGTPGAERRQWRDTFEAGRVLIGQAAAQGVPHLIVAGTIEELGDCEGSLGVDLPPRPRTQYSLCKTLLREYAEYTARREGIRIDWFRPFVVYGPGQRGEMLIPSAFQAAKTGQPCDFTDGLQSRDFLFVEDLARWLRFALGLSPDAKQFRLHHLGTGTAIPVREALEIIRDEFPGAPFRIGARSRRPGEPLVQRAPRYGSEEPAVAGWSAEIGLREGLRRTAAWWRRESASS